MSLPHLQAPGELGQRQKISVLLSKPLYFTGTILFRKESLVCQFLSLPSKHKQSRRSKKKKLNDSHFVYLWTSRTCIRRETYSIYISLYIIYKNGTRKILINSISFLQTIFISQFNKPLSTIRIQKIHKYFVHFHRYFFRVLFKLL